MFLDLFLLLYVILHCNHLTNEMNMNAKKYLYKNRSQFPKRNYITIGLQIWPGDIIYNHKEPHQIK